nr:MAG TPA_asm: hypothetical protein [Caudoviricetes sp.]
MYMVSLGVRFLLNPFLFVKSCNKNTTITL